jgi:hypothetical protein
MYKTLLIDDLRNWNVFGQSLAYIHTVKFQKCGLPHIHLLLTLSSKFCLSTPKQVNRVIKATWPDPQKEPCLFNIIKRQMVRSPCGSFNLQSSCMKDRKCTKGFPKAFQPETMLRSALKSSPVQSFCHFWKRLRLRPVHILSLGLKN